MDRISRFVVWICSRFDREQILRIVDELNVILEHPDTGIKPRDDFKKNIHTIATTSLTPPSRSPRRPRPKSPH